MKLKTINQACTDTVIDETGSDVTMGWDGLDSNGELKPTERQIKANDERDWFITGDDEPDETGQDKIENRVKRHDEILQKHSILLARIDSKIDNIATVVSRLRN